MSALILSGCESTQIQSEKQTSNPVSTEQYVFRKKEVVAPAQIVGKECDPLVEQETVVEGAVDAIKEHVKCKSTNNINAAYLNMLDKLAKETGDVVGFKLWEQQADYDPTKYGIEK